MNQLAPAEKIILKVLLVDDDEDDFVLIRGLLADVERFAFTIDWASTYQIGLELLRQDQINAVLVDYDLGAQNGLDFIRQAVAAGIKAPMIMVTGRGRYEIDIEAMQAGAADYISKTELNSPYLERAIRYAIERRRVEEILEQRVRLRTHELIQANALLENVFASVDLHIAYLDRDFNFLRVNQRYADAGGHDPAFYAGKNHFELYPHAENEAIFRRVVNTGEPFSAIARPFIYPDQPQRGVTYWDWSLLAVREPGGPVSGLVLSLVDVTRRVLAEQKLAFQAHLLENVSDAIFATSLDFTILSWNKAAERLYGWSAAEAIGRSSQDLLRTELSGITRLEAIRAVIETGAYQGEAIQYRKDGRPLHVEVKVNTLKDAAGQVTGFVGLFCDVTARKKIAAELRATAALFQGLFAAAPEALLLVKDGRIERLNRQAEELFGYPAAELAGQPIERLIPTRYHTAHIAHRARYHQDPQNRPMGLGLDLFALHKDGGTFPVDVTLSPLVVEGQTYVICIVLDLRKRQLSAAP